MENADRQIVWIIHYQHYDGGDPGIVDRAYSSEEEAQWQTKLLIDLSYGSGRTYTLHSLPVV